MARSYYLRRVWVDLWLWTLCVSGGVIFQALESRDKIEVSSQRGCVNAL